MRTDHDIARSAPTLAAAAALALLSGCAIVNHLSRAGAGISFTTEPPGARVLVDRRDSGFVTPCRLSLSRERHYVDLELSGYATAKLRIDRSLKTDTVLWKDMFVRHETWDFPLWLNLEDALEPYKVTPGLSPGHVFVRLERASGDPPEGVPSTHAERTSAALPDGDAAEDSAEGPTAVAAQAPAR